ncbi:MAG TPA: sigma-70 family RNA polymerase sigma factor [Phenylobacterium sp.]|uniref:RNA polymerase sigma factor n=1 Tax=Phenylobacterium sp. TaxID=1871053 RepID=UPI002B9E916B|nr:sigma-70 family RNA polymerase sigma factor [Phenylobacterium sp.]HXA38634.1 sigma-70 family RNA polymerase sigma factor [Phenylobacterium sp.]
MDRQVGQDERYATAAAEFGGAIERLARAYEAQVEARRDLVQDIHVAVWRSLAGFDGRCSLRTWVYRVAHNTAASHVQRRRRWRGEQGATLEALEAVADTDDPEAAAGERQALDRLMAIIQALGSPDRQVALLYLEDLDAAAIGEITGLSAGAVATKIHRLKALLARRFAPKRQDRGGRA